MPKFILKKIKDPDNRFDFSDITIEADIESLDEMEDMITSFIRACGYNPSLSCVFLEDVEPDIKEDIEEDKKSNGAG